MQIFISDTYEGLSALAANHLRLFMEKAGQPLVGVASGDSPAGMYRHLVKGVSEQGWDISGWDFVGLDEWLGMNGSDEGSCRWHLDRQFFGPLAIPEERICFFNGRAEDPLQECRQTESFIDAHHSIDVAILGLGLNGHIGMNEPGSDPEQRSHIAELAPQTIETAQKYFSRQTEIRGGLTLGLGTILSARNIFLLAAGTKKAPVVKQMVEGPISNKLPASLLRSHMGARIYLDREAASLLKTN